MIRIYWTVAKFCKTVSIFVLQHQMAWFTAPKKSVEKKCELAVSNFDFSSPKELKFRCRSFTSHFRPIFLNYLIGGQSAEWDAVSFNARCHFNPRNVERKILPASKGLKRDHGKKFSPENVPTLKNRARQQSHKSRYFFPSCNFFFAGVHIYCEKTRVSSREWGNGLIFAVFLSSPRFSLWGFGLRD